MLDKKKIAIVGAGTMGRALGAGLLRSQAVAPEDLAGTIRHAARVNEVSELASFPIGTDRPRRPRWAPPRWCSRPARTRPLSRTTC